MEALIQAVLGSLGTALGAALLWLVTKLIERAGLQVDAAKRAKIESAIKWAVAYAEEYGADYLKKTGKKLPGVEKAELALSRAMSKIPNIDEAEAAAMIKAVLPQVGLGAVAVGKALRTPRQRKVA